MSRTDAYAGPDFRDPAQRPAAVRGLSERLAIKAAQALDHQRVFLPRYEVKQLPDKPNEQSRSDA